jgi:dTDP-4-amino-4,6-dideoxygalactose transaminase
VIQFNVPLYFGGEENYIAKAIQNRKICGDGYFTKLSSKELEKISGTSKALLTTSCTHALEMSAILCDIKAGDEVIMPSYTFVSTANAFALRGAKIIFVDIRPDTMNIDEKLIEAAITEKTKAIVPVHYAGVGCEMEVIKKIADDNNLYIIEDAAQGLGSAYNNVPLGAIGHLGCMSFHETKNVSCGEGGAIFVNDDNFAERAEIIREKGTNRSKFFRGEIDKYFWCDIGSSFLPSELNAAYLLAGLENITNINTDRMATWNFYNETLNDLKIRGLIETPYVPKNCNHNAHMFWIKLKDISERTEFISYLNQNGINSVFHYIPLHSSIAGRNFGEFRGEDKFTTSESERLVRLPLYYGMKQSDKEKVVEKIHNFFIIHNLNRNNSYGALYA